MTAASRPTEVLVDPEAIEANVATLAAIAAPAQVCAVVKADGYGHGAVVAARAALAGGAGHLAVAVPEEAVALRCAGIDAPVIVLAEVADRSGAELLAAHAVETTAYSAAGVGLLASVGSDRPIGVHLKVDTGMHRVGVDPEDALDLARLIVATPGVDLIGTCTHLAVADEPSRSMTVTQLERFDRVLDALAGAGIDPGIRHAANSAGALCHPAARYDMVRCGIAVYGIHPSPATEGTAELLPALALRSVVSYVRRVPAGDGVSYGLHGAAPVDRTIAVVPIGYADGVDRRIGLGIGHVLIGGRPRPVVGAITMDQLMVDCGDDPVERGDEVVLIGRQGDAEVTAEDWARWIGTIPYEVVARLGPRLPRR